MKKIKDLTITFAFILLIGALVILMFNYLGNNPNKEGPSNDGQRIENCGPGGTWC